MSFDIERFMRDASTLTAPTAKIPVPDLKHWFAEGEEPIWEIRGLTGEEWARANDVTGRMEIYRAVVEALASEVRASQTEALKTMMGVSDVPQDLAKRFDHLMYGSVNPKITRESAVVIFKLYPYIGYLLTNKILELSGQGPDLGKLQFFTTEPT